MIYFLLQRIYRQNTPEDAPVYRTTDDGSNVTEGFPRYAIIVQKNKHGRVISPSRLTTRQTKHFEPTQIPYTRSNA